MGRFSDLTRGARNRIETLATVETDPRPRTGDDDGDGDRDDGRRLVASSRSRVRSGVRSFESRLRDLRDVARSGMDMESRGHVQVFEPPREDYERWRSLRKNVTLLKAPIEQFARDVTADGRRGTSDSEEATEYLEAWLSQCAIISKQRGKDMIELVKQISEALDDWGTVYVEVVPDGSNPDMPAALKTVHPGTITEYTRPNGSLLLAPDETDYEGVKLTDGGEAAAFVQYDHDADHQWTDGNGEILPENRLTNDQLIKIVESPDVGSGEGNGAVAVVEDRIEAMLDKLANKEVSIEAKAWGQWFVGAEPLVVDTAEGTEVIWPPEGAESELARQMEGMKPGDVLTHEGKLNIQDLPGDVPEILEDLRFDVDYIVSAMPQPKYVVGWESDINQFVTDGQETAHEKLEDARMSTIERALSPVMEAVLEASPHSSEGAGFSLEPEEEESPILSHDEETIGKIKTWFEALKIASGSADPTTLIAEEDLAELGLQVPPDVMLDRDAETNALDEADPEVQRQFERFRQQQDGPPPEEGPDVPPGSNGQQPPGVEATGDVDDLPQDKIETLADLHNVTYDGTKSGKLTESDIDPDDFESHYLIVGETKSDSSFPVVDADGYLRKGNVEAAWNLRGHAEVSKDDLETKLKTLAGKFDNLDLGDGDGGDSDE